MASRAVVTGRDSDPFIHAHERRKKKKRTILSGQVSYPRTKKEETKRGMNA